MTTNQPPTRSHLNADRVATLATRTGHTVGHIETVLSEMGVAFDPQPTKAAATAYLVDAFYAARRTS